MFGVIIGNQFFFVFPKYSLLSKEVLKKQFTYKERTNRLIPDFASEY